MRYTKFAVLVLGVSLVAHPACAGLRTMDLGDNDNLFFRGNAGNLPVGSFVTPEDAIRWAYTMPQVQAALQEMAGRGYIGHPNANRAGGTNNPVGTHVFFAFEKVGLPQTPDHAASPELIVSTFLDGSGVPYTTVIGGVLFVDRHTGRMFTADSLEQYRDTDPSFEVINAGGGGNPEDPVIIPIKKTYRTGIDPDLRNKLIGFAGCAAIANTAVVVSAVRWGPAALAEPWVALAAVTALVMLATAGCAWGYFGPH